MYGKILQRNEKEGVTSAQSFLFASPPIKKTYRSKSDSFSDYSLTLFVLVFYKTDKNESKG